MSVVAVIPARAASKRVPNKNTRLVADRPLVYYSIRNALVSELVDRVIVTTNSSEVRIIAQQLGAEVHWRDEALCGDDVSLDPVVYDVVKELDGVDYVVTMQPTAPLLTVATLDDAIRRAREDNLDTLISVTNVPRLSWKGGRGSRLSLIHI